MLAAPLSPTRAPPASGSAQSLHWAGPSSWPACMGINGATPARKRVGRRLCAPDVSKTEHNVSPDRQFQMSATPRRCKAQLHWGSLASFPHCACKWGIIRRQLWYLRARPMEIVQFVFTYCDAPGELFISKLSNSAAFTVLA